MIWNFCIRRPVLTVVVFIVLAIFGAYGYLQMPVQENPDVDFPIVSVNVVLPGASPGVIESEIIEPLEAEINTIEGLRQLRSTARQQVATIIAEFELWRDIDIAAQDVRDAVDRAQRRLPTDAEAPIVRKLDLAAQAIMWISLTGDQRWDPVRLTEYADTVVRQRLESVRGVGQIQIGGMQKYAVRILLDPERLAAHHVTVQDVVRTIQASNVEIPTGTLEGARREFVIQTLGQFEDAAPFNDLIVAYRNGAPVRLSDVGASVDGVRDDRQLARFSGEATVGLGVVKQADANTVELARTVRERLEQISGDFPPGLMYHIATDTSEFVQESIADLTMTIFMATGLVVLVVLAFLRSGRGTLVTLVAIPTSLLVGLAVINVLGFSINVLTMLGLILVIGIVIDDGIVVLERAHLHLENGAEPEPAARVGTTEVAFPAIANTLALGAVFIPVAFTGGLIGRFFLEFGITVAVTVFASTFVALTLTPVMCSRLLRSKAPSRQEREDEHSARAQRTGVLRRIGRTANSAAERGFGIVESGYRRLLAAAFRHRGATVVVGVAAFVLGLVALTGISREFAPADDRSSFMMIFETPRGATLRETDAFASQIESVVLGTPEVRNMFLAIGLGQGGPGEPNRGISFVRLLPRQERDRHQSIVMQELRERLNELPGGRAFVTDLTPGGIGGAPVEVVLKHPDLDELARRQEALIAWMEAQPEWYVGVRTDLELNNPQVDVTIDRERASEMGISVLDIASTLQYLFGRPAISAVERDAQRYDVIPDIAGRGRLTPEVLGDLYVRPVGLVGGGGAGAAGGGGGALVPLDSLVRVEETIGPSQINRFNRMRSATVSAQTPPGVALGDAVDRLERYLNQDMNAGAVAWGGEYELAGQSQLFEESFYYLTLAMAFAIVFIYLVLAAQFESFIHPLTIMLALPLATVGAFGGLWVVGHPLNIFAFIGLIMLVGLVTKNSILLVDYTTVLIRRGLPPLEAAQQAGHVRFRPVVMTAVSTVLGMMPIALGYGAGGEARVPLGVVVAVGLLTSTMLTLVIVPVAYSLVDQMRVWAADQLYHRDTESTEREQGFR